MLLWSRPRQLKVAPPWSLAARRQAQPSSSHPRLMAAGLTLWQQQIQGNFGTSRDCLQLQPRLFSRLRNPWYLRFILLVSIERR